MKRRIAQLITQLILPIPGACMAGMTLAVVLFMIKKVQDAMAGGHSMEMVFEILALAAFAFILGILALFLWGIVNILKRPIVWLYISAFVVIIVWVIYDRIRDAIAEGRLMQTLLMWALALVGWLVIAIVVLGGFALAEWGMDTLRRQIRKRQYRLPEGVTKEMVLRESPYKLIRGGWGEPDYYIVDKRTGEFVDWDDPEGAEGWIIRQYLKQRRNEQRDRTSG